ncbi:MAG: response regulator [Ardenticatenaceae bacterium]|nr:response regulator [Ardenticatenaceae bacterium]MCB9445379.1 response regulator [Ardenticatenaceae bacterium]
MMTKILVVDDNEQNIYMLQILFAGHGYDVDTAQHGSEALQTARQSPPDMIITDILMPVMDGFELCRQWKADERLYGRPFVFYTATYTDPKDEAFALSLGADAFLIKPLDPDKLLAVINKLLHDFQENGAARPSSTSLNEEEIYKLYSERLVQKLEHKMLQLEQEIEDRRQTESALQASNQRLLQAMRDLKDMQKQIVRQERLAAVGQLAAGMAHDFNNMLSIVSLNAEVMLYRGQLSEPDVAGAQMILHQVQQAHQLIQQILDFTRRTNLERRATDLVLTLQEMVNILRRTLPENMQISLDFTPGEYVVHVDRTRIEQVVMNLALNARDAMPNGGNLNVKLANSRTLPDSLSLLSEPAEGNWIVLTVADEGTGIADEILPHLFEPFFTTKPPGKGTGLGLAQVYGIVKQHEGHIDVHSEVGRGTTFTIFLPATSSALMEGAKGPQEAIPLGEGEVILVVEDDQDTRKAILTSLEILNYRILTVANGKTALAYLERHPGIALILSDVYMPEMGGIELAEALYGTAVPVILMTGHEEEGLQHLKDEGRIIDWLRKPLNLSLLAEAIAVTINRG